MTLTKAKTYKFKCVVCGKQGRAYTHNRRFCSNKCKNSVKTEKRYIRENNDWYAYFRHILSKKNNSTLTAEQLIGKIAEQNYKCALTGLEMTCIRKRGEIILTNASIDRISAGKEYNYDNIQIVCRAVNSFRGNMEIQEFINWCNRVSDYALQE